MIKFIIIEDDQKEQQNIKKIIKTLTFNLEEEVKIDTYQKLNHKLYNEIMDLSTRKIYLMDIELESGYTGIKIAKLIREKDWESEIIFITNHGKMFKCVYRSIFKVFDFIEKYKNFTLRLEKDIKEILKMNFDKKMFKYQGRNLDLQLFFKEILYIYRDTEERKAVIVTSQNQFLVNLSIQDTLAKLDERFKLVHRACIANMDRVQQFNWKDRYFILDNGLKVDLLSKKYRKEVEVKC